MLNGQSERAESILNPGALLLEKGRPVGVIVGDNDRPYSVFFHAHPVMVFSWNRITKVAAKASLLGYRAAMLNPGQTEKNSVRAYVFRFALSFKLVHRSKSEGHAETAKGSSGVTVFRFSGGQGC